MSFEGKVIVITGASSGIGAAAAKLFAKEGASVVMVGRNQVKLAAVEAECSTLGSEPLVLRADVSNEDDANRIIKETIDKYGKLDILVNNAGMSRSGNLIQGTIMSSYDEVMNVNLRAPVFLTNLATPHLVKSKGNVINISSIAGSKVSKLASIAYSISKAGLNQFSRAAALELAPHGVRVNIISPGPVVTDIIENTGGKKTWDDLKPFTALKRVSEAEEVAELIAFLASDAAVGITGSDYVIDNGATLL